MDNEVTAIIKTFNRPDCLDKLLKSIDRYYPKLKCIIIDDGNIPPPASVQRHTYVPMPFDVGLSAGRNHALSLLTTPYFLLLDDDFEFTPETKVELLLKYAKEGNFDIMGGLVKDLPGGKIIDYYGDLILDENRLLHYIITEYPPNANYSQCDVVVNFFLGKTQAVAKYGGWDAKLKLAEHTAFFWEMRTKLKIGYTKQVIINHIPIRDADYWTYRKRGGEFFQIFLQDHNIAGAINFIGVVTMNTQRDHPIDLNPLVKIVGSRIPDIKAIEEGGEYWYTLFTSSGWLKPGMRVLDYGAGLGRISIPFSRIAKVKAIDVNLDMVDYMKSRGIQAYVAFNLQPVLKERFDFVISTFVLQHNDIADAQVLTRQISSVTDVFYFTYPVVDLTHNKGLSSYAHYKEVKKLPLLQNTQSSRLMERSELAVLFDGSLFDSTTITSLGDPKLNLYRIVKRGQTEQQRMQQRKLQLRQQREQRREQQRGQQRGLGRQLLWR